MSRPLNILFLMTDQQRWDALGCVGGWVGTPNLDRIASSGVRFSRCVTTSPECIPTRVSLATGLYPHNTGLWSNIPYELPDTTPTWMRVVRDCGYRTSLFGKTHWHPHEGDLRAREHLLRAYGFDDIDEVTGPRASVQCLTHMTHRWQEKGLWEAYRADFATRFATKPHLVRPSALPLEEYYDVYVGQRAVQYLRQYDYPNPWFCWVSFPGPHEPWDTPEPYASMYPPESMPTAISRPIWPGGRPRGHLDRLAAEAASFEPGEISRLRADYAGNVTLIDDQIGQILGAVADRGELDRTVIIFTSDHGEMNGDHGLLYKSNFLQPSVGVPLLIRVPGIGAAGVTCRAAAELIDIGPTIVELAGGDLEYQQFGRSLCPSIRDPAVTVRSDAISEIVGEVMLTDGQWKIALNPDGDPYMLFDLEADPDETQNLAGRQEVASEETQLKLKVLRRFCQSQVRLPRT